MTQDEHPRKLRREDFEFRWERAAYPVALAIGIMSAYCEARGDTIGLHVYTPHFDVDKAAPHALRERDYTPGIYWRGDSGLTLGVVRNSLARWSVYAAHTLHSDTGRWALTVGAITGYRYREVSSIDLCPKHGSPQSNPCTFVHGYSSAHLRPLVAPSFAWIEAREYIGATPRIALLGKAVNFSVEWSLR